MITVRRSEDRGFADHGWLKARHTFSFAGYFSRAHMGFGPLRVINEDRIAGGQGFGTHPHNDMEIITYILEGELEHRDSMGNGSIIRAGDVQYMCAGTGVQHSEFNPSDATTHLLQIWILPSERGLEPRYDQRHFDRATLEDCLHPIISGDGRGGSMIMNQDATLYGSILQQGQAVDHTFAGDRHGWIQVVRGGVTVNGTALSDGDGAAISGERRLTFEAGDAAEFLFFDLA